MSMLDDYSDEDLSGLLQIRRLGNIYNIIYIYNIYYFEELYAFCFHFLLVFMKNGRIKGCLISHFLIILMELQKFSNPLGEIKNYRNFF